MGMSIFPRSQKVDRVLTPFTESLDDAGEGAPVGTGRQVDDEDNMAWASSTLVVFGTGIEEWANSDVGEIPSPTCLL